MEHYEIAGIQVPYTGEELGTYIPVGKDDWQYATIDLEKVQKIVKKDGRAGLKNFTDIALKLAKHSAKADILESKLGFKERTGLEGVIDKRQQIANTIHFFNYIFDRLFL